MSDTETPNPKSEAQDNTATADPTTKETTEPAENSAESELDTENLSAEPGPDSTEEPPKETPPAPVIDYLSPSLLTGITTVTPDQLLSMETSEVEKRDTALDELISKSVGEIREDRVIKGRVIGSNDREVLVDIGFKSEGIVPREEFGDGVLPHIGDEITVYLVRMEDIHGQTVLSKEKADFMARWAEIREKSETAEVITGTISRRIKGGLIVDLGGVPAFLPGSQVDIRPVQDFDNYIGREFEFKIVKINESRKNIVLSRKELLEADMKEKRADLISGLKIGQTLQGRVKNLTDFGAFVDLGGLDGLLHITDLSWGRVQHPSEVVSLDEEITVKVIDFDPEKQRVSLGLKQLQPHPWDSVSDKFPTGSIVDGKVVSMTNYGAFVEIEKGVEGLIHVSEMSWTKHIRHPSEMFTLGEAIQAKILSIDIDERKISLGVKQLQPDPWDQIEEKYAVGSLQTGVVRNLTQFGAFVEIEEGIDGLIHVTDLSWTKNVRHPKEILEKGDEVEIRILDVSRENRRIALGYKQVADDPWEQLESHFTSGKQVQGEVFRILEKGVILQMELDIEGIIPTREMSKSDREALAADLNSGDVLEVTVQELNVEDKKVVLMPDFNKISSAPVAEEPKPDTEEAPQAEAEEAPEEAQATSAAQADDEVETAELESSEPEAATGETVAGEGEVEEKPAKEKAAGKTKKKTAPAEEETAEVAVVKKPRKAAAKEKTKAAKKTTTAKKTKKAAAGDEKKVAKPAAKKTKAAKKTTKTKPQG